MEAARWAIANVSPDLGSHIEGPMAWRKTDFLSESPSTDATLSLIAWTQSSFNATR
jgi:hypothetical protein